MKQKTFKIHFHTPAFLGDAQQSGRWRTPPFKAQLRQFWRMAHAAGQGFAVNIDTMRRAEGEIFGTAAQADASSKSEIRIRLSHWDEGKLNKGAWQNCSPVNHPETDGRKPNADLYLGYGPILQKSPFLKAQAAIQSDESAQLLIAYPEKHAADIEVALKLMHLYGAVGGRSRNSWGSYSLEDTVLEHMPAIQIPTRRWESCLREDWPHAIGSDEKGALVWQTRPHADWKKLLTELAQLKIALRTHFSFPTERPDGQVHDRHWLSYPISKSHRVDAWDRNNARLPNSLRFKVRRTDQDQLVGVIFHIPHKPPVSFNPNLQAITRVWSTVHGLLENNKSLTRISA